MKNFPNDLSKYIEPGIKPKSDFFLNLGTKLIRNRRDFLKIRRLAAAASTAFTLLSLGVVRWIA
jgi:hypothetical protein